MLTRSNNVMKLHDFYQPDVPHTSTYPIDTYTHCHTHALYIAHSVYPWTLQRSVFQVDGRASCFSRFKLPVGFGRLCFSVIAVGAWAPWKQHRYWYQRRILQIFCTLEIWVKGSKGKGILDIWNFYVKKVGFGMLLCDSFDFFHEGLGKVFNLSVFLEGWACFTPRGGDSTTTPLQSPEFCSCNHQSWRVPHSLYGLCKGIAIN